MITLGQANLWRGVVRQALWDAVHSHVPFSKVETEKEFFHQIRDRVLRATFIAKFDGEEYSRLKR